MVVVYTVLLLLATLLPGLIWLLFFLREDPHPEPKSLLLYAFAFGGLITMPTLAVQIFFQNFAAKMVIAPIVIVFGLAITEEIFKFLAAYFAVNREPAFDEPVDGMIYMIAAALGFATIENLFVVSNQLYLSGSSNLIGAFSILSLRFIGATLLHTLSSALVGYYWARGKFGGGLAKNIATGLVSGSAIHAFFNYLVYAFQNTSLLYPSIFLVAAAFFILTDFEKLKSPEK
jgi:RsiW-degrading membrane proteinase PrsW (M82 family)